MTALTLATEGYLIADAIAQAKVPVIVHPTMQRSAGSPTCSSMRPPMSSISPMAMAITG